jgi:hypothetical protein
MRGPLPARPFPRECVETLPRGNSFFPFHCALSLSARLPRWCLALPVLSWCPLEKNVPRAADPLAMKIDRQPSSKQGSDVCPARGALGCRRVARGRCRGRGGSILCSLRLETGVDALTSMSSLPNRRRAACSRCSMPPVRCLFPQPLAAIQYQASASARHGTRRARL